MTKAANYLALNHKYIQDAETLIEKGDFVQASEKFWGAAATIVKNVAAKKGVKIRSHEGLHKFVSKLEVELDDPELTRLFELAATLHQNFYENWLPPRTVVNLGEAVKQLVEKLEGVM